MTMNAPGFKPFRESVKGKRQRFFEAQGVDDLMNICLALSQEVWTLRARQKVLEQAAIEHGWLEAGGLDAMADAAGETEADRHELHAFIDRVLFTLREEAEALAAGSAAEPPGPEIG